MSLDSSWSIISLPSLLKILDPAACQKSQLFFSVYGTFSCVKTFVCREPIGSLILTAMRTQPPYEELLWEGLEKINQSILKRHSKLNPFTFFPSHRHSFEVTAAPRAEPQQANAGRCNAS
jgi:hypothetical protein